MYGLIVADTLREFVTACSSATRHEVIRSTLRRVGDAMATRARVFVPGSMFFRAAVADGAFKTLPSTPVDRRGLTSDERRATTMDAVESALFTDTPLVPADMYDVAAAAMTPDGGRRRRRRVPVVVDLSDDTPRVPMGVGVSLPVQTCVIQGMGRTNLRAKLDSVLAKILDVSGPSSFPVGPPAVRRENFVRAMGMTPLRLEPPPNAENLGGAMWQSLEAFVDHHARQSFVRRSKGVTMTKFTLSGRHRGPAGTDFRTPTRSEYNRAHTVPDSNVRALFPTLEDPWRRPGATLEPGIGVRGSRPLPAVMTTLGTNEGGGLEMIKATHSIPPAMLALLNQYGAELTPFNETSTWMPLSNWVYDPDTTTGGARVRTLAAGASGVYHRATAEPMAVSASMAPVPQDSGIFNQFGAGKGALRNVVGRPALGDIFKGLMTQDFAEAERVYRYRADAGAAERHGTIPDIRAFANGIPQMESERVPGDVACTVSSTLAVLQATSGSGVMSYGRAARAVAGFPRSSLSPESVHAAGSVGWDMQILAAGCLRRSTAEAVPLFAVSPWTHPVSVDNRSTQPIAIASDTVLMAGYVPQHFLAIARSTHDSLATSHRVRSFGRITSGGTPSTSHAANFIGPLGLSTGALKCPADVNRQFVFNNSCQALWLQSARVLASIAGGDDAVEFLRKWCFKPALEQVLPPLKKGGAPRVIRTLQPTADVGDTSQFILAPSRSATRRAAERRRGKPGIPSTCWPFVADDFGDAVAAAVPSNVAEAAAAGAPRGGSVLFTSGGEGVVDLSRSHGELGRSFSTSRDVTVVPCVSLTDSHYNSIERAGCVPSDGTTRHPVGLPPDTHFNTMQLAEHHRVQPAAAQTMPFLQLFPSASTDTLKRVTRLSASTHVGGVVDVETPAQLLDVRGVAQFKPVGLQLKPVIKTTKKGKKQHKAATGRYAQMVASAKLTTNATVKAVRESLVGQNVDLLNAETEGAIKAIVAELKGSGGRQAVAGTVRGLATVDPNSASAKAMPSTHKGNGCTTAIHAAVAYGSGPTSPTLPVGGLKNLLSRHLSRACVSFSVTTVTPVPVSQRVSSASRVGGLVSHSDGHAVVPATAALDLAYAGVLGGDWGTPSPSTATVATVNSEEGAPVKRQRVTRTPVLDSMALTKWGVTVPGALRASSGRIHIKSVKPVSRFAPTGLEDDGDESLSGRQTVPEALAAAVVTILVDTKQDYRPAPRRMSVVVGPIAMASIRTAELAAEGSIAALTRDVLAEMVENCQVPEPADLYEVFVRQPHPEQVKKW